MRKTIYSDSKIVSKILLGRTKASTIAYNVLGPASLETHIKELLENKTFFSISSDASNHGNIKLFPILLRYYVAGKGIKQCLFDFFDDAKESAADIFNNLRRLENAGLNFNRVSSYSADNASVNFGKHNSVFTLLKRENNHILPVGCPAHMLNNAVRYALDRCNFDVENLVLKTYSHFSCNAKRVEELKSFFEFVDLEYRGLLRHVTTRWLSLYPAVERLLKNISAIRSYFVSLGDNCPLALKNFFQKMAVKKKQNVICLFLKIYSS